jgi:hypothetical protein
MNSFDLFRTLVHARNGNPGEDSIENHYPIAENVTKVGPDDIIVSDYETHRADKAVAIVRNLGLSNQVTVTDGGKHQGWVWDKLLVKPQTHTGDHYRSDVESPNQNYIKGIHCTQHNYTEAEQKLVELGFKNLALLCREARLTTWSDDPKHRAIQVCQTNYNFPVLFMASVLLNRKNPTGNLIFSARDCFMWVRLMQAMYGRGEYWYTSCHARINADANYEQYTQSFDLAGEGIVLVDLSGSGGSFTKLAEKNRVLFGNSVLMYKPLRFNASNSVPALFQSQDVWRLEQCNRAPHQKCMGVDGAGQPIWLDRQCATAETSNLIEAQVKAFGRAVSLLDRYELRPEKSLADVAYTAGMDWLLHRYIKFADAVEPLRQLDIAEDKE